MLNICMAIICMQNPVFYIMKIVFAINDKNVV